MHSWTSPPPLLSLSLSLPSTFHRMTSSLTCTPSLFVPTTPMRWRLTTSVSKVVASRTTGTSSLPRRSPTLKPRSLRTGMTEQRSMTPTLPSQRYCDTKYIIAVSCYKCLRKGLDLEVGGTWKLALALAKIRMCAQYVDDHYLLVCRIGTSLNTFRIPMLRSQRTGMTTWTESGNHPWSQIQSTKVSKFIGDKN